MRREVEIRWVGFVFGGDWEGGFREGWRLSQGGKGKGKEGKKNRD